MNLQYKNLIRHILVNGSRIKGRNGFVMGIPSYAFTVEEMTFNHLLLLRKMYTKGIYGEFKTLIDKIPLTNVSQFEDNGCFYWSTWAGSNGKLYLDYWNELHPAMGDIIQGIKDDPYSRRHVISLWNHDHVKTGVLSLASCWHNLTFSVIEDTLHLTWTQRSVDTMVGLPSDVYLAYLFMAHVAEQTNLKVGSCMFALSNVHIYWEHLEGAKQLLERSIEDKDLPLKFKVKP